MSECVYSIKAFTRSWDWYEDRDCLQINGTVEEIKKNLLERKISHVSCCVSNFFVPTSKIDEKFLVLCSEKHDGSVWYLYRAYINGLKREFERLAGSGVPHPLWPLRDKLYVVKTGICSTDFWIGSDPFIGVIGIPIEEEEFLFIQELIKALRDLPDGCGRESTRQAVEDFYTKKSLPIDYYHPEYEKPDPVGYYSQKF
jgi:hypothetical protein